MSDAPALGLCCICEQQLATAIIMLEQRGAIPGRGWGCIACGLPADGACAVICEACLPGWQANPDALTRCCRGYPGTDGRIAISELSPEPFDHDAAMHAAQDAMLEGVGDQGGPS